MPDTLHSDNGGQCDPTLGACDNYHGHAVPLSTDWEEYTVLFSEMEQRPYGQRFDLDLTSVVKIEFEIENAPDFEVGVDEVAFILASP